jgi:transcriptional regulator of acetoin/glycerol metabolism
MKIVTKNMTPDVIQGLIVCYGSVPKTAKVLNITSSALYERMHRVGLKPAGYRLLPGEPVNFREKADWLRDLLKTKTVKEIAKDFGITPSAVRSRMMSYGIKLTLDKDVRVAMFKTLLKKYKTGTAVAKVLNVSTQTVYERIKLYGLEGLLQQKAVTHEPRTAECKV